ncbi:GEVED domain-containing protein [Halocola ammonii]
MMKKYTLLFLFTGLLLTGFSQSGEPAGPTLISNASSMTEIPAIASMESVQPPSGEEAGEMKRRGANKVVPGKGLPHGADPLADLQQSAQRGASVEPILTFNANVSGSLQDPTGAIGPNHFVNAWNSGFRIHDRDGNPLTPAASLGTIFPGETLGDPCVVYDRYADRFVIIQFSDTPNSILVAVCQGPDPVNDGWYTYRFETGSFPDYEKISVWSDGYYITANKNSGSAGTSEVVYALDREAMLNGIEDAAFVGFPLPGITTSGFYSPAGFNANGAEAPPAGDAPIVYMQDDSWAGVNNDHLKIWNINMDWDNLGNSEISSPQEIPTTAFDGVFDGGSFANLTQPDGTDIDALQATIMYMAQYRRFAGYNACVMNWVVDLTNSDELAGIRWVELRQDADGEPWEIYQEGTYTQPDGLSAFSGGICMDVDGNIGLGYTVVSEEEFPGIRFTGRFAGDPLGEMTVPEGTFVDNGTNDPFFRYGDYAQMTIDPLDDKTFWHIGEYFPNGNQRASRVGVFKLAPDLNNDVGILDITSPEDGTLTASEEITVTVRNYGIQTQSDIPVSFQIDGGAVVNEVVPGPIEGSENVNYTFTATGDFSTLGETYTITAFTSLENDENSTNDEFVKTVEHISPNDVGVETIVAPVSSPELSESESIIVEINNYGGAPQSGFEVYYTINDGPQVTETVTETIETLSSLEFTFDTQGDFSALGDYTIEAGTNLDGDVDNSNDVAETTITKTLCQPEQDCTFGDGLYLIEVGDISNTTGCSDGGYADYTSQSTDLERNQFHDMTITTNYGDQHVRAWIDFNDNFVFEFDEVVLPDYTIAQGQAGGSFTETVQIEIPQDANLGEHLMRIKTAWDEIVPFDACADSEYGETEDYTANVIEETSISEAFMGEGKLVVETNGNDQYTVVFTTEKVDEPLQISVHNVMGQQVVQNWVEKNGNEYTYTLDMSYAAAGAYLIRLGNEKGGKVTRIVVE